MLRKAATGMSNVVDPAFKMSYELRRDQEAAARYSRLTRDREYGGADDRDGDQQTPGHGSARLAFIVGLALLGLGTGFQLGRDQYGMYKTYG